MTAKQPTNANADYWMKTAREARNEAGKFRQLYTDRCAELDRMRVQLSKKDVELEVLREKSLALVNHLVKYENWTGYEATVQEVLFQIPAEMREQ